MRELSPAKTPFPSPPLPSKTRMIRLINRTSSLTYDSRELCLVPTKSQCPPLVYNLSRNTDFERERGWTIRLGASRYVSRVWTWEMLAENCTCLPRTRHPPGLPKWVQGQIDLSRAFPSILSGRADRGSSVAERRDTHGRIIALSSPRVRSVRSLKSLIRPQI